MLRIAADLLEQQTAQTAKSKPFFPTNDYRRIYIEIEAHRMAGRAFPAPYNTYAELAELLTAEVGWFVDEQKIRQNFWFMGQNAGYDVLSSPINTGMRDS